MDTSLILLLLGVTGAFCMLFSLGANDVANSIGVAIGSKALTSRAAIVLAALCNLLGATLGGAHVTKTLSHSVSPALSNSLNSTVAALGFLCALFASSMTIFLGTLLALPLSSTHAVVGGVAGAGVVVGGGVKGVAWGKFGEIGMAWVLSPVLGGLLGGVIRWGAYRAGKGGRFGKVARGVLCGLGLGVAGGVLVGCVENAMTGRVLAGYVVSGALMLGGFVVGGRWWRREYVENEEGRFLSVTEDETNMESGEFWRWMLIMTVCSVAFAHGSNDVANGVGPFVAILRHYLGKDVGKWLMIGVLGCGGVGIALGLSVMGWRVVQTIGGTGEQGLTGIEWSFERAFAAESAAAGCVMGASLVGLPVSTSHVVVGAVVGVGLSDVLMAEKGEADGVRWRVLTKVLIGGLLTPIISGALSAALVLLTTRFMAE